MIAKTTETTILTEATQNYYLGEAYGMRAYLYFHLLRSWGDVVLYLDYTEGQNLDLSNITKGVSPATEVMEQIKRKTFRHQKMPLALTILSNWDVTFGLPQQLKC